MLGPKKSYVAMLEENYVAETSHDKSPLRPSAAGYCARKLAEEYAAYKEGRERIDTVDSRTARLFKLGHKIEEQVIEEFEGLKNFRVLYKQQIVDHGLLADGTSLLEGSMDWCLINETDRCIMDAKSRKDRPSQSGYTGWDEDGTYLKALPGVTQIDEYGYYIEDLRDFINVCNDSSLVQNLIQLNVYATSTFCYLRDIDHASIIRYNKNDSRLLEIRFKPSTAVLVQVLEKFNLVLTTPKEEVPCSCRVGSQGAKWCDYSGAQAPEPQDPEEDAVTATPITDLPSELREDILEYVSERAYQKTAFLNLEDGIVKALLRLKKSEIMMDNGVCYRLKFLKSPNPHYELRVKVQKQR